MGAYDHSKFKVITIGIDVHKGLSSLKRKVTDSFNDVIRRMLKIVDGRNDVAFSFVRPISEQTKEFYRSGLFD